MNRGAGGCYLSEMVNSRQARRGNARVAPPRRAVSRTRTRAAALVPEALVPEALVLEALPTSTQVLAGPLEWLDFRQVVFPGSGMRCIFPRTNL